MAARGYEAELISGVPSFCAVAAKLGISLCENDERLLIVPASCDLQDSMDIKANKIFMKAGSRLEDLKQQLARHDLLDSASVVENCGMENEHIYPKFGDMKQPGGYFSVVVVKNK